MYFLYLIQFISLFFLLENEFCVIISHCYRPNTVIYALRVRINDNKNTIKRGKLYTKI